MIPATHLQGTLHIEHAQPGEVLHAGDPHLVGILDRPLQRGRAADDRCLDLRHQIHRGEELPQRQLGIRVDGDEVVHLEQFAEVLGHLVGDDAVRPAGVVTVHGRTHSRVRCGEVVGGAATCRVVQLQTLSAVGATVAGVEVGEHRLTHVVDRSGMDDLDGSGRLVGQGEVASLRHLDAHRLGGDAEPVASVDASLGGGEGGKGLAGLACLVEFVRHEGAQQPAPAMSGTHRDVGDELCRFQVSVAGVDGLVVAGEGRNR